MLIPCGTLICLGFTNYRLSLRNVLFLQIDTDWPELYTVFLAMGEGQKQALKLIWPVSHGMAKLKRSIPDHCFSLGCFVKLLQRLHFKNLDFLLFYYTS